DFDSTDVTGGTTLTQGTWAVFDGATLNVKVGNVATNLTTNNATIVLDGADPVFSNLANLAVNARTPRALHPPPSTTPPHLTNLGYLLIDFTRVLTVRGGYTQGPAATLEIQLGGVGLSGQVNITGNANLDGTLTLTPVNGYTPTTGDAFTILTFAARNGTDF